jgi:thymidylate kinase
LGIDVRQMSVTNRRRTRLVTFSGLDGAGKSSQAELLRETLTADGVQAVIEWVPVAINPSIGTMKSVAKGILRAFVRADRTGAAGGERDDASDPGKRLVRRSATVRHVWSTVVTVANIVSHWRVMLRHAGRGRIVIFDRYALDSAVRLHTWYDELGSVRFQSWLVRTLSPRPSISFLLDVPADTALTRKVDRWDLEQLRRQAVIYRSECKTFRVKGLDGTRPRDELAVEIAREVSEHLRLNGT